MTAGSTANPASLSSFIYSYIRYNTQLPPKHPYTLTGHFIFYLELSMTTVYIPEGSGKGQRHIPVP